MPNRSLPVRGLDFERPATLEPMAGQIGADQFDAGAAVGERPTVEDRVPHRWEEQTFDVRIGDREIVDLLVLTFEKRWNLAIEHESRDLADVEAGRKLREDWLIP